MPASLRLSQDTERGLHLLVAPDEIVALSAWLALEGVRFEEDRDASTTCAGPVLHVLLFGDDVERAALQGALDRYPGPE